MTDFKWIVTDHTGKHIGAANNFKDAKDLHKQHLPDDLQNLYAGIDTHRLNFDFHAVPAFYSDEMTDDLIQKYGFGE